MKKIKTVTEFDILLSFIRGEFKKTFSGKKRNIPFGVDFWSNKKITIAELKLREESICLRVGFTNKADLLIESDVMDLRKFALILWNEKLAPQYCRIKHFANEAEFPLFQFLCGYDRGEYNHVFIFLSYEIQLLDKLLKNNGFSVSDKIELNVLANHDFPSLVAACFKYKEGPVKFPLFEYQRFICQHSESNFPCVQRDNIYRLKLIKNSSSFYNMNPYLRSFFDRVVDEDSGKYFGSSNMIKGVIV